MPLNSRQPICTEADYRADLAARAAASLQAQPGEPKLDELDALATLLEAYEVIHYPMLP